jgi:Concanavalin A-like lectin/glucanases superfamily
MQSIVRRIRTIGNFENAGGLFVPSAGVDLARSFNGTSDFIDVGNSSALNPASITVSCWVYWKGTYDTNGEQWFVGRDDNTLGRVFALGLSGGNPPLVVQVNGAFTVGNVGSLTINTWEQITFTGSSAAGYEVWLNGTGGGASPPGTSMATSTGDVTIGERTYNTNHGFVNGDITEIAIWNTVLTPTQISNLASGQRANTIGANANLVGYWPILGQSPEPDESGNGNNGVLTGTTIVAGPPSLQPF